MIEGSCDPKPARERFHFCELDSRKPVSEAWGALKSDAAIKTGQESAGVPEAIPAHKCERDGVYTEVDRMIQLALVRS